MNSLLSCALELQHAAHELMYLGMDGEPIYSDTFCRLNKEVLVKSNSLFYDYGDKEQKKQSVLDRAYTILEQLPTSLLKVRLLTYCYGEIYEEALLQEARVIIGQWDKNALTPEQTEIMEELKNIEENQYPFEVLD